jgi:hypothetical protein
MAGLTDNGIVHTGRNSVRYGKIGLPQWWVGTSKREFVRVERFLEPEGDLG